MNSGVGPVRMERVAKTYLVKQAQHRLVGQKKVVIEVLERPLPTGPAAKAGGKPAKLRAVLVNCDFGASGGRCLGGERACEIVGRRQPRHTTANDGDTARRPGQISGFF